LGGGLEPYAKVWRTGANEATTISFQDEVAINGHKLAAGNYALFTIPGEKEWTIIFNKEAIQWGAFNYNENEDALRLTVIPQFVGESKERLNFSFSNVTESNAEVKLHWEKIVVTFNISVDTQKKAIWNMRAAIANLEANDWATALRCASYCMLNNILHEEADQWLDQSIAINENFRNLRAKAEILAKKGEKKEAIQIAERAISVGKKSDRPPSQQNVIQLEEMISQWGESL